MPRFTAIRIDRYDMLEPKVQRQGDAAILTFNLVSYRTRADGTEDAVARWNSTETYGRVDGQWRIVHSHWSYVRPELKQPIAETLCAGGSSRSFLARIGAR